MKKVGSFLLFLIIIGIGLLVFYYIYQNNQNDLSIDIITNKDLSGTVKEIDFDNCQKTKCDYTLNISSTKYKLTYVKEDPITKLLLNNREMISDQLACGNFNYLNVVDDVILISYQKGCELPENHIVVFNKKGETIFNYDKINDSLVEFNTTEIDYEINNKDIIIKTTKLVGNQYYLNGNFIDLCNPWIATKNSITDETPVKYQYSIKYLGNNKFNEPVQSSMTLLKDVKNETWCQ